MMIVKPLATEKAAGDASIAEARLVRLVNTGSTEVVTCLLYTSDAADDA